MTNPEYRLMIEGSDTDLFVLVSLIGLGIDQMNRMTKMLGQRTVRIGEEDFLGRVLLEVKTSAVEELPDLTQEEVEDRLKQGETELQVRLDRSGGEDE